MIDITPGSPIFALICPRIIKVLAKLVRLFKQLLNRVTFHRDGLNFILHFRRRCIRYRNAVVFLILVQVSVDTLDAELGQLFVPDS